MTALCLMGCSASSVATPVTTSAAIATTDPPRSSPVPIQLEIVAEHPHDATAFTQGLEFRGRDVLLESTGGRGTSEARAVDPDTGAVTRRVPLADRYFGEGLTVGPDGVVQLTWTSGVAFLREPESLSVIRRLPLDTEGWGVAWDEAGGRYVTSDGTATLRFRDREDFTETGRVEVRREGESVSRLNELEMVDGVLYANVWQTGLILRIDPADGTVTGVIDASPLVERVGPRPDEDDVLNGVAHRPGDPPDRLWVTGKDWPTVFVVDLIEP